jgi:hypothetical protein
VPHEQRQLALAVLHQEILRVHLLDLIGPVRVHLGRHAAWREHDLLDRLSTDFDVAAADMERAHIAQCNRLLRERRCCNKRRRGGGESRLQHNVLPFS